MCSLPPVVRGYYRKRTISIVVEAAVVDGEEGEENPMIDPSSWKTEKMKMEK